MDHIRHRYRLEALGYRIISQSELRKNWASSTYAAPSLREMVHALS